MKVRSAWMLIARKDLTILRRSPLLLVLLAAYAIGVPLLLGLALSGGGGKPPVALLNEVPKSERKVEVGGREIDAQSYEDRLVSEIDAVEVSNRQQAYEAVQSGRAVAAIILPADLLKRLTTPLGSPKVEVVYNSDNPIKRDAVKSLIDSRLAEANLAIAREFSKVIGQTVETFVKGGQVNLGGFQLDALGLDNAKRIVEQSQAAAPKGSPESRQLGQVVSYLDFASGALKLAAPALQSVAEPIKAKQVELSGGRAPLAGFLGAVALAAALLVIGLLLGAGLVALEREDRTLERLLRGPVSAGSLLLGKLVATAICGIGVGGVTALALVPAAGVGRAAVPGLIVAASAGAIATSAVGILLGALARDVRAASLLAVLLALPLTFAALVPSGAVSNTLYNAIRAVSALFPVAPSIDAAGAAIGQSDMLVPCLHLLAIAAVSLGLSALVLRRSR